MKKTLLTVLMASIGTLLFATTHQVSIQNFAFAPASLTIQMGDTVVWTNLDGAPHTATSTATPANGEFDSGNMTQGDTFKFVFTVDGDYAYFCEIHPTRMRATIKVEKPLGISGVEFDAIKLYPNPVSNNASIDGVSETTSYTLFDANGKLVSEGDVKSVNWESLEVGSYLIQLQLEGNKSKSIRFIKN